MQFPTLGEIITASKNQDNLGTSDRATIVDYVQRSLDLAQWKANWDPYLGTMDICSDAEGYVTFPFDVDTILACNVGGFPAYFRNSWFEYHINGPGSSIGRTDGVLGPATGYTWDDKGYTPVFQNLKEWSYLAAIVEDPIDGDGTIQLQVFGETMDQGYNEKQVLTIPVVGPSQPGVFLTLLNGYAATDSAATQFRSISRVIKPITRGYVKLLAFPGTQGASGVTIGYYGPNETQPQYRRIRVSSPCKWVRVKYRRKAIQLVNDTDLIPIPSKQALLYLMKAAKLADTFVIDAAEYYQGKALEILTDIETIVNGPGTFHLQVDPSFGVGCIDLR